MSNNLNINAKEYINSIIERLDYYELTQMKDKEERKDRIREEIESDLIDWIEQATEEVFKHYVSKMENK